MVCESLEKTTVSFVSFAQATFIDDHGLRPTVIGRLTCPQNAWPPEMRIAQIASPVIYNRERCTMTYYCPLQTCVWFHIRFNGVSLSLMGCSPSPGGGGGDVAVEELSRLLKGDC